MPPFKKIGRNKFRSPSGRIFTRSQVRLYYVKGGKFCWLKEKESLDQVIGSMLLGMRSAVIMRALVFSKEPDMEKRAGLTR